MMCYKDMTFCTYWYICMDGSAGNCPRALTEDVKRDADKWWGTEGAPIAVFLERPSCFYCVSKKGDSIFEK